MNPISTHPCPDCGATFIDNNLEHAPTCPISIAMDAAMDADRAWFASHPNATAYYRELNVADMDDMRRAMPELPIGGRWEGRVQVVQLEPGIRVRRFDHVRYITAA